MPRSRRFLFPAVCVLGSIGWTLPQGTAPPAPAAAEETTGAEGLVLPESPDLNRFLDKAKRFIGEGKFEDGVADIQRILEGKALDAGLAGANDPFRVLYSADGRLYLPLADHCRRLLCRLPADGIEAYRLLVDGRARAAFEEAAARLDAKALRRAAVRYFASSFGARITSLLADLEELGGELERADLWRRRLLEEYPGLGESERRLLLLRLAHASALLGERPERDEALARLTAADPGASYRVAGELVPARELAGHPAFRLREGAGAPRTPEARPDPLPMGPLVPLWRFRFAQPDPYGLRRRVRRQGTQQVFFGGGRGLLMPDVKSFRTGVPPAWDRSRGLLVFKDHERLVLLDLLSGKLRASLPSEPRAWERAARYRPPVQRGNGVLRLRVPALDLAQQRVVIAGNEAFFTADKRAASNFAGSAGGRRLPFRNRLVCYDLAKRTERWRVRLKDEQGREIFVQTPPVVVGDRLFVPGYRDGAFLICRVAVADGRLERTVLLHEGGSPLLVVPAAPPVVSGDVLIHSTNAGAVAALRLPDLDLLWLRRYELRTRHQAGPPRKLMAGGRWWGIRETRLRGWFPQAPLVRGGRVVVAPLDSDAIICLELATGRLRWALPRKEGPEHEIDLRQIVGLENGRLYLAGSHLQCVDFESGKRLWEVPLDGIPFGLGLVFGGSVYLPYPRQIRRYSAADGTLEGTYELAPAPGEDEEDLPFTIRIADRELLAVSEAGLAAYAVPDDLVAHSATAAERVARLLAAGRIDDAWRVLAARIEEGSAGPDEAALYVRLTGEVAEAAAKRDGLDSALALIDRAEGVAGRRPEFLLHRIRLLEGSDRRAELRALSEKLSLVHLPFAKEGGR